VKSGEIFEPRKKKWEAIPPMSAGRSGHAAVSVAGAIYVGGGRVMGRPTSGLERWSFGARQWETLPPMQIRRCSFAMAAACGKLYVCGGDDGSGRAIDSVERFDISTQAWEPLPALLVARARAVAVVVASRTVKRKETESQLAQAGGSAVAECG